MTLQTHAILDRDAEITVLSQTVAAVLVHIDLDADRVHGSSLAAVAAGRQLASSWGATLYAAAIVHAPEAARGRSSPSTSAYEPVQRELARAGIDKIALVMTDAAVAPLWGAVGTAWQTVK